MLSSWRYLGTAVGFGFGVVWMTVGIAEAILVLLCAAFGFGVAFIAERERAGMITRRSASPTPVVDDLVIDDFELDHFERHDDELLEDEPADVEMAAVSTEAADYGWPHG